MMKHWDKVKEKDIIKMVKRELCYAAKAAKAGNDDRFMEELEDAYSLLGDYYAYMKSRKA